MAPASLLKKPVFAVTNFGTRIVVAVSLDCTVGHFKKEFENAHLSCFPELGKIRVHALKVRRKSCFYDLSELFPLKYAFQGADSWFLHIVAHHVQNQSASKKNDRRLKRNKWKKRRKFPCFKAAFIEVLRAAHLLKRKKKKCLETRKVRDSKHRDNGLEQETLVSKGRVLAFASRGDGDWDLGRNVGAEKECLSETISETISVSGIIKRYFSSCDEVNSNSRLSFMELQTKSNDQMKVGIAKDYRNIHFGIPSPLVPKTPPQVQCQVHHDPNLRSLEEKPRTNIGVRVVEASKSLGLSSTKKSLALSLSKSIGGGSVVIGSADTHIRRLMFEISDEDD